MKIISLLENTCTNEKVFTEHGLSLYIETSGHKILFDMGQSDLFAKNAEALEIDLKNIDIAILSHGHYDHGGGLKKFLEINSTAPVYIHKYAFGEHFSGTEKYIGLDKSLQNSDRIIFTENNFIIDKDISLCTCNDLNPLFPLSNEKMNIKTDHGFISDSFKHEQYLVISEKDKKTVISGCSHKGILNISEWFKPDILVGGFHFKNIELTAEGKEKLHTVGKKLAEYNTVFYTCHCTGTEQFEYMKNSMSDKLNYISCGDSIII